MIERGYVWIIDIFWGREGCLNIRKVEEGIIFNIVYYVIKGKVLFIILFFIFIN